MVDTGFSTPTENIVEGEVLNMLNRNVKTATNMYPGRLATRDTTDYGVKIADAVAPVTGWIGYEQMNLDDMKDARTTILAANDEAKILTGGNFNIYTSLAPGPTVIAGDLAFSWANGEVVAGQIINGVPCIRLLYGNTATVETDMNLDLPSGVIVPHAPHVQCTTYVASSTIDFGILSTEGGGDADGFLDGVAAAATGFVALVQVDASAGNITVGAMLTDTEIKDATGTPVYYAVPLLPGHVGDGTATSISYTTNDKAIAGYIWLPVSSPGIRVVGQFPYSLATSSSSQGIWVNSSL